MNARFNSAMQEAVRLTRAGSLLEATALIQRSLGGAVSPAPAANSSHVTVAEEVEDADFYMVESGPAQEAARPNEEPRRRTRPGRTAKARVGRLWPGLDKAAANEQWQVLRGPLARSPLRQPPEPLPDGAQFLTESFTNASGTRSYKLYIPSGFQGQSLPLVVMLHGCTQDPDDFAAGSRMNELAEREMCFVAYPAQSSAANHSRCWNWFKSGDQQRDSGEPSIIAGLTREICDNYPVDRRRVFVAGMSAGGAMAVTMAVRHPDLYAAVGIHSGLPHAVAGDLPSALAAMHGGASPLAPQTRQARSAGPAFPTIVFHGDRDTTVHPGNGDKVIAQCVADSSAVRSDAGRVKVEQGQVPAGRAYTRKVYHGADGKPVAEHWLVHGAGHSWSGGSDRGSYTDPSGPDATGQMFRFFLEHPRAEVSA